MNKRKRVALYARVLTASQTTENQFLELRAVAERNGWQIFAEVGDDGISGAKAETSLRPTHQASKKTRVRRDHGLGYRQACDLPLIRHTALLEPLQSLHYLSRW